MPIQRDGMESVLHGCTWCNDDADNGDDDGDGDGDG
jgi:hypothetical protein